MTGVDTALAVGTLVAAGLNAGALLIFTWAIRPMVVKEGAASHIRWHQGLNKTMEPLMPILSVVSLVLGIARLIVVSDLAPVSRVILPGALASVVVVARSFDDSVKGRMALS